MSWTLLIVVVSALGFSVLVTLQRRSDLARQRRSIKGREEAVRTGAHEGKLLHPVVDLSRCLGCATCVAVCPEEEVLEIVHGQAMVVRGSSCQGISACERECPVGAITVTIANLEQRKDVPVLDHELAAVGQPGVYLAGEITAHALIRAAVDQGTRVARAVRQRVREPQGRAQREAFDLVIVGAGPAGLACALEAKRIGLDYLLIDREQGVGGTVAKYPRRKLVMTEPVDLPLHGRLASATYSKEQLMQLWTDIATTEELRFCGGRTFTGLERDADQVLHVVTETESFPARNVCLALGRRGTPRRLGVPGEDLAHVAYGLVDADSFDGRRVLVVGGGDAAVEAALALSRVNHSGGIEVMLSYRGTEFRRVRSRNRAHLEQARAAGRVQVVLASQVVTILPDTVELDVETEHGRERVVVQADDVLVLAGGVLPLELLGNAGVSFDASSRGPVSKPTEQGTGLVRALRIGFGLSLVVLLFTLWHFDYYALDHADRPAHPKHKLLRPGLGAGLWFGCISLVMITLNLLYLVRRSPRFKLRWFSLETWMTAHVATGILAMLLVALHAAMAPRDTVGGHAFWLLAFLLVTGAIGRYFYAYVPRAANGRELELAEVKEAITGGLATGETNERDFGARARAEVTALVDRRQWKASFLGRALSLLGVQFDLTRVLRRLTNEGRKEGISEDKIKRVLRLARRAHRTALTAAHYEDLRAILGTWRFLHRWVAALMVLLVGMHIVNALLYGEMYSAGGTR